MFHRVFRQGTRQGTLRGHCSGVIAQEAIGGPQPYCFNFA